MDDDGLSKVVLIVSVMAEAFTNELRALPELLLFTP